MAVNRSIMLQLLGESVTWSSTNDGFNRESMWGDAGHMSNEQADAIYPGLASNLHKVCEVQGNVTNEDVARLLVIYDSDIHLPCVTGDMVALGEVRNVNIGESEVTFDACGHSYRVIKDEDSKSTFFQPINHAPNPCSVSQLWLNEHHEGWRGRLEAAIGLEYDLTEAVKAMLVKMPEADNGIVVSDFVR